MLRSFAELGIRAPKRVLALAGLVLVAAVLYGASAASHLSSGGFNDPQSPSSRAATVLADRFDAGGTNLVLQVSSAAGPDSAAARTRGIALVQRLRGEPGVDQVSSYWTAPAPQAAALRGTDGRSALVLARVAGDDSAAPKRASQVVAGLTGTADGVTVKAGGQAVAFGQVNDHVTADLAVSEAVAVPLTTIALIWVFGSLIASLLPLAVGIASIIGTLGVLRLIASMTSVSIYALNMTTAMGLALAIDYSLFVVSRYREEVAAGADRDDAIRTTMRTAGRTVLFSALTVGLSLAAMLVFPVYFLRSFAYAGLAVVAFATLAALLLLPAMLKLLGHRLDALDLRRGIRRVLRRPEPAPKPVEQGFWYRFATAVMRRAVPVGLLVTAFLVMLGLPFLHARYAYPDERVLPPTASAYQVGTDLRTTFPGDAGSTISIVATDAPTSPAGYASALSRLPQVASVQAATGTYAGGRQVGPGDPAMRSGDATYLQVRTDADPLSDPGKHALTAVKDVPAPWQVLYGGSTAVNADSLSAIGGALPLALALIVLATLLVLFLFTGSVLLPLKAVVLNTLSLSATFGAMVWVFQEGHLSGLYGDLTTTGFLTPTMPPLMFCLAFGLSMDYEVFLLSRIREAWLASDRTGADNTRAVALGLGHTGRIVTAAALLMSIVFAAIATSSVSFMMMFGTGLTLAVLMDATLVRATLVPAFMRVAGQWNWWAPGPLRRLHERIGLTESGPGAPGRGPGRLLPHDDRVGAPDPVGSGERS
ncbi:MAG: MMPL family transporter [Jatrophihabitans sp.]|nr:MAG: MMPL family transporter [Jatrophihabitans sp.]